MPEISVYGLTHEEIRELTQLAKQRYGKARCRGWQNGF